MNNLIIKIMLKEIKKSKFLNIIIINPVKIKQNKISLNNNNLIIILVKKYMMIIIILTKKFLKTFNKIIAIVKIMC